jgi:hypothetical protein
VALRFAGDPPDFVSADEVIEYRDDQKSVALTRTTQSWGECPNRVNSVDVAVRRPFPV